MGLGFIVPHDFGEAVGGYIPVLVFLTLVLTTVIKNCPEDIPSASEQHNV